MDYTDIIQKSLDYIEENLRAELTAGELAGQAGFSLYHYYRVFQSATGMPVMQYIQRRRLLHGVYAIRSGSRGIDAALSYGFDTYPGFYRAFLREFGCTPSAFIRSHRARRPCRIDLKQEEHMTITPKKAAQILKNWDLAEEPLAAVYCDGTGNSKDNAYYVGNSYVLKATANLGRLKKHAGLSRALESAGLQAASCVPTADGREFVADGELYFCLTRRVPGHQMQTADLYADADNARFLGGIIGRLHQALEGLEEYVSDADLFATVRDWALPGAKDALGLDDAFCRKYLEDFGALVPKLPVQIIHRDPNPANIIRSGDRWGFIDFELSERNIRIYDPCYAATAVLSESFGGDHDRWPALCREIMAGYDSIAALTDEERRAIPYVILANQLVCVAWFAGQEKYADLFRTNVAMTHFILTHFHELDMSL